MMLHNLVLLLACGAPGSEPSPTGQVPLEEVRRLVAFLVETAEKNLARSQPRTGDALADHYIRAAARFAIQQELSPRAFLVALGIGLDRTNWVRSNRVAGWYLKQVESDAARKRRLKVLGKPSFLGREDWLQHFVVSAALIAHAGPTVTEQIGIWKELRDARGRSGFSFADLAADYAGICFARSLLDPGRDVSRALNGIAKDFQGKLHLPDMKDLEDGLPHDDLVRKYGEPTDPRFQRGCQAVRQRVANLPVFRELTKQTTNE